MSLFWLLLLLIATTTTTTLGQSSKCICQTSSCLCCVELNLTSSIDLGGPTCVNLRQTQRNVSLNLSYADNPVHNATIALDLAENKPTCMNLLSDLAQICARFVSMKALSSAEDRAYKGCLVVEPALLGTPQATYAVGCFLFEQGQVRQSESTELSVDKDSSSGAGAQEDDDEEDQGLNAEDLLAVVSASAEQGIALFSQWLGLNLAPKLNASSSADKPQQQRSAPNTTGLGRHARRLPMFLESEDKSDEKFKLILSAQDNILKESATIGDGDSSTGVPTAFLYSQPNSQEASASHSNSPVTISPENLVVVPLESRRGGRAYNIRQHVNEV